MVGTKVTTVNFAPSTYFRPTVPGALSLRNRYFEKDPFLSEDGAALLARPGLSFFTQVGDGPVRGLFSQPGSFQGDLFVASGGSLFRVKPDKSFSLVTSGLYNPDKGVVKMAATANIESTPAYLFIADGQKLLCYTESANAFGSLSGSPVANDTVRIDNVYYRWTSGAIPATGDTGSSATPWLVKLGLTPTESFSNLARAIEASGTAGTTYSNGLQKNTAVTVRGVSAGSISIQAVALGIFGNSIVTQVITGAGISWTGATLGGSGTSSVFQVNLPADVGAIDVAVVNSFTIVIPSQGDERNGRFYWIEPGETLVDPLNFATAERSPDRLYGVRVVGDQFWLSGEASTEVWYISPDASSPVQRLQGVVFDRGTWKGTAVAVHESLIVCDSGGAVFRIQGGTPQRISTPDIEESIRLAIQKEQSVIIL